MSRETAVLEQTQFSAELANEIERLTRRAESGSDWAEICALEAIMIAADGGDVCILSRSEQRSAT